MKSLKSILTVIVVSLISHMACSQSVAGGSASDEFDFRVYPNPAADETTVSIEVGETETPLDIFILEINGKIITEYNYDNVSGSGKFTLPLDHLVNGIYSIAVQTNETYRVERLIVLK